MNILKSSMIAALKDIAQDLKYQDRELSHEGLLAALVLSIAELKEELHQINLELRREK